MGLSFRSRIFGVSLVIGLHYTGNIILLAWRFSHQSMFNTHNVIHGITDCIVYGVLIAYFAVEEPVRKFILSHYISSDAGIKFHLPSARSRLRGCRWCFTGRLRASRLEIMRRATIKMRELEASGSPGD